MTLYYYMYRSWQDCCRRGENRSWPSVSVESVDSEYWCLNNAIVYAFVMRLTVEERVLWSTFKLNTLYKCVCVVEGYVGSASEPVFLNPPMEMWWRTLVVL